MAYLLIDIGNTFLKWGTYSRATPGARSLAHERTIASGRVLLEEISMVTKEWRRQPLPDAVVISNVAGTAVVNPVMRALEVWPDAPEAHWIVSRAEQCGVKNGYLNPAALGCDRWAALIGARALLGERAALVVVCGTATTMDLLTADGNFLGGGIMPGLGLMVRALHQNTATLPDAHGDYIDYPRQTVDAIASGCMHAQAGAVERLFFLHKRHHPDLRCILSGGAARTLGPRLTIDFTYHEHLVLEGLYQIAASLTPPAAPEAAGRAEPHARGERS
ncbi:MAG: type III pantothenate kinase [Burkholderiaceae bacterium]|nr:type III pantothenate kinase [Burkholderiaceae bacterium]